MPSQKNIPVWPFLLVAAAAALVLVAAILYFAKHPLVQEVPQNGLSPAATTKPTP